MDPKWIEDPIMPLMVVGYKDPRGVWRFALSHFNPKLTVFGEFRPPSPGVEEPHQANFHVNRSIFHTKPCENYPFAKF